MNHTITMSESERHEIGNLSIRISVGQTIHSADQITVYGWNNSADLDDEFGDCEVEVATVKMSASDLAAYNDNTRHALTFTLTQQQIDDALALFNETYLSQGGHAPEDKMFEKSRVVWDAEDRIRRGDIELHDNIVGNFHRDASWRWIVVGVQDSTFTVLDQEWKTRTIEKSRLQKHGDWYWDGKRPPRHHAEEPDPDNFFTF